MNRWIIFLVLILIFYNNFRKKENFTNTKNVYLISNNSKLTDEYIKKINNINLNHSDKVVRFNHSGNPNIFKNQTDIAFFRNNSESYWGYKLPIWNNLHNKDIVLLGKNPKTDICKSDAEKRGNNVSILDYNKVEGKTESSGTQAIKYFSNDKNINKIYLVGFTFYDGKVNWHNFEREKEILNKYPNKVIQL
jgi:hypothetical protein